jgi:hypothetical protein
MNNNNAEEDLYDEYSEEIDEIQNKIYESVGLTYPLLERLQVRCRVKKDGAVKKARDYYNDLLQRNKNNINHVKPAHLSDEVYNDCFNVAHKRSRELLEEIVNNCLHDEQLVRPNNFYNNNNNGNMNMEGGRKKRKGSKKSKKSRKFKKSKKSKKTRKSKK